MPVRAPAFSKNGLLIGSSSIKPLSAARVRRLMQQITRLNQKNPAVVGVIETVVAYALRK